MRLILRWRVTNHEVIDRLMIVVFTSTAFTDWVAKHVESSANTAFNPYLTVLFTALCVFIVQRVG